VNTGGSNTGGTSDGGSGAPGDSGAGGTDGGSDSGGPTGPAPRVTALSQTGHDRLFGVTRDAGGNIYATGQISSAVDATADFSILVAKFSATGDLVSGFGTGGVATKNVTVGGTSREIARGIVVQSTGKIVVAGNAEHDPTASGVAANDTDIVLLRFDSTTGALDTTFGNQGVVRIDLNSGVETAGTTGPTLSGGDTAWGLALAAGDKLVLHGTQRSADSVPDGGIRSDNDWVLMRLSADGVPDSTFSGDGKVTLDIGQGSASARGIIVLGDGSIIAAGYTRTDVLGTVSQQPVLYKVTANGDFDGTFATTDPIGLSGVWHDYAAPDGAEAYSVVPSGDKFVTIGYGPTPGSGTGTDLTCFRFSAAGDRDLTFGTNGATIFDVGGYADNGRFGVALPNGRVMGIGAGRKAPPSPLPQGEQPEADGLVFILAADGKPDTSFGTNGFRLYDVGGAADQFWAGSLSFDQKQVAVVGIASGETATDDDDAALLLLPVEP
jgi:uncharacterized delta-60 repeat protein